MGRGGGVAWKRWKRFLDRSLCARGPQVARDNAATGRGECTPGSGPLPRLFAGIYLWGVMRGAAPRLQPACAALCDVEQG